MALPAVQNPLLPSTTSTEGFATEPEKVRDGRGRIKRIAIIALARKLLVALWRFVAQGLVPNGAVLKLVKPA